MYNYELINGHIVVSINDKKFLIDTGSPNSFWIREPISHVEIDAKSYSLGNRPVNLDVIDTTECVGIELDGFIGLDIIYQTSLTIYKNGLLDFSFHDIDGQNLPMSTSGFLSINVGCNKMNGRFVIDTGAKYGYGVKGLFYNLNPYAHVEDYNPILKHLDSDIYHLDVVIAGKIRSVNVCDNPIVSFTLKNMGAIVIASVIDLFDEACVIDIKRGLLVLK